MTRHAIAHHPQAGVRRALGAAMLGMLLDGYDLSIMAVVLLPLHSTWHLHAAEIGLLMGMALIGSLLGGLFGGVITDHFGRRRLLIPNMLLYIGGALLSACSPNLAVLFAGRLLTGLAIGLDYPLVATIVAEYTPSALRGNRFARVNLAWYVGALLSTAAGWALLFTGVDSWRWMLGSAVIPALALLWLRRGLPESPRWLVRHGRTQEADQALSQLHPESTAAARQTMLQGFAAPTHSWRILAQKSWLRRLFLSIFPWFCLDVVGLGIGLYFPLVLRSNDFAPSNAAAAAINAGILCISVVGIGYMMTRIDRWGRVPLQIAGFSLMATGLLGFALASAEHWLVGIYAASAIYALGVGIGPGVTVFAFATELFPTELRASAAGLATGLSRAGALLSAALFPIVEKNWGIPRLLVIMAAISLLAVFVTWRYGIEPRQKSLEELEKM
ncbi:MFS transporter [Acidithiobacillus sp. IBUN Pt1247-S3]|uniref:MFS transporter n=1 Tax=Acidithiobacillus sp. IBUN Pt1247-S3 TaxID=3166642 RepID=UPI0034E58B8E